MDLESIIRESRLNWRRARIGLSPAFGLQFSFPLNPADYLNFAHEDFSAGTTRGMVNAISNAKRAIDCEAAGLLTFLGYSPFDDLPEQAAAYIDSFQRRHGGIDAPLQLKLIHALGVAPANVIQRVRRVRNLVEHEYAIPTREQAQDAIELAQLFIRAIESFKTYELVLGDDRNMFDCGLTEGCYCVLVGWSGSRELHASAIRRDEEWGLGVTTPMVRVDISNEFFLPILRLMVAAGVKGDSTSALQELVEMVMPVPDGHVAVTGVLES